MLSKIIRNFIAKRVAGRSDDGIMITLKDPKKVDFQAAMMEDLLMRNGIDPRAITSEEQLKNIINQIESVAKQQTQVRPGKQGIRNTQSAKVFDLKGRKIENTDNIMGGEEMPPPGSRGGADDIAAPVQSAEETLKDMIQAENKKNIAAMKKRKMLDDAIEDASPGFANDIKYDAEIVAENLAERMGLVYDDLPTKQRLDLYDEAYSGLSKQRFKNKPEPEDKADGGRIGYKKGTIDLARRGFMKAAAGVGAGIGALKMGALKLLGKEGTKQVTKQIIKTDNVPGKPEWFDALVTKVINQGEDVTKKFATKEREIVHMKKLDEDTTVKVTQDLDNGAIRVEYDSPDNMYGDPVQLQYKKPLPDEGDPRPSAEFDVAESGPVGRSFGPDDYEIEIDEVGGTSIKDLTSDVSKLKEYAVGKKPTLKEFVQSKKRKDRAKKISEGGENEMDEVIRRQGEFIQFEDIDPNMASGGIARMLGE